MTEEVRMVSHRDVGRALSMLVFDDGENSYFARQQVRERRQGAELPPGVQPQLAPLSTAIGEIFRYRVKDDSLSAREVRTIEDWTVARQLKIVPGVADVLSLGGLVKPAEVNPSPARLKRSDLALHQR